MTMTRCITTGCVDLNLQFSTVFEDTGRGATFVWATGLVEAARHVIREAGLQLTVLIDGGDTTIAHELLMSNIRFNRYVAALKTCPLALE